MVTPNARARRAIGVELCVTAAQGLRCSSGYNLTAVPEAVTISMPPPEPTWIVS